MIFTCANPKCGQLFKSYEKKARYCSLDCKYLCRRSFDIAELRVMTARGDKLKDMAQHFGCKPNSLSQAIRQHGLLHQWLQARYA
jgi:hypothetical protein